METRTDIGYNMSNEELIGNTEAIVSFIQDYFNNHHDLEISIDSNEKELSYLLKTLEQTNKKKKRILKAKKQIKKCNFKITFANRLITDLTNKYNEFKERLEHIGYTHKRIKELEGYGVHGCKYDKMF